MNPIETRNMYWAAIFTMASSVMPAVSESAVAQRRSVSAEFMGNAVFEGSTIVSMPTGFQPELIYKKYPTDESVAPAEAWQLSFGVRFMSQAPTIQVTLRPDPANPNANIQILGDSATFVPQNGLYNNYDPSQRFEIMYTGTLDPFVGPIDFLLAPDGFTEIPVRVHLNVTDQPGFPISFNQVSSASPAVGDIASDGKMEIVVSGEHAGQRALHAFDQAGNPVPGWPFFSNDPSIVDQAFSTPVIVDLDRDGHNEVVVVEFTIRNPQGRGKSRSIETSTTLNVIEGSGQLRWQVTSDFEEIAIPAVADLDGDGDLDIVVGTQTNLKRFGIDGVPLNGWQVETLNDINVAIPVIADVDGNSSNGLEIVACTPVFGPTPHSQVYVWKQDGSLLGPMWPKELDACQAPTVLDLDGDRTNGLEIVVALDHFTNPPVDPKTGFLNTFSVFAWHADGSNVNGWPHHFLRAPNIGLVDDRIIGSCSAGDVDGDGDMEVVVPTYGEGDPANGNLFVFHHDGTLDPNWPQWAGIAQTPSNWGGVALGDLDGDGRLEIVTASFRGVYVFRANGQPYEGFPKLTSDNFTQPMIADIDDDGTLEIVQAALFDYLYAWKFLRPSPDSRPWPGFRQNPAHTGTLIRAPVAPIPTLSYTGLAAAFCLLVGAGAFIIRRNTGRSSS